uniref:GtrA/DPMS transmembrane domain-containing protein n=1 Tax=Chaetoceros debilis TaxID=122233 RepID=A0A7S3PXD5_9STRA
MDDGWKINDVELTSNGVSSRSSSECLKERDNLKVSVGKYREEMRKRRISSGRCPIKMCTFIVERIQGVYLPVGFSSYLPVSTDDNNAMHPAGRVPLFRGIDKVLNGKRPASELVTICGIKPLRYFWYMISGGLCDIVQFGIDFLLLHALHVNDSSTCWALGFGISIVVRHSSHRYLVFGDYVGGYWKSLMRMYTGYSIIIVISTLFNIFMTKVLMLSHYTAWIATLLWTGIVNYFILKYIWSFDGKKPGSSRDGDSSAEEDEGLESREIV